MTVQVRKTETLDECKKWVDDLFKTATDVVENGLHPNYNGVIRSFVMDFYGGDFPWTEPDRTRVSYLFATDPRLTEVNSKFQEKFGALLWSKEDTEYWEQETGCKIDEYELGTW